MCSHYLDFVPCKKKIGEKKNFSELIGKNWEKRETEEKAKENVNICEKDCLRV